MSFYSARLLFIILVDDGRPKKRNDYNESVIVFRATSWDQARERALELGRAKESSFRNQSNQPVRWALVDILSLDLVGKRVDGSEVSSCMFKKVSKEPIEPTQIFNPDDSSPPQSF